jgi:hypothetical protein
MLTTIAPSKQTRLITAPSATYTGVVTRRYHVKARRFESCQATLDFQDFDVLVRQDIWANDQLNRTLKAATGQDWRVEEKELAQTCQAF